MPWLRIEEVGRLDHVVLLVAAQAVLRAEGGGELDVGQGRQRVERVRQVARHRRRMGEQGDAAAVERRAQGGVGEQAVDAELDATLPSRRSGAARTSRDCESPAASPHAAAPSSSGRRHGSR